MIKKLTFLALIVFAVIFQFNTINAATGGAISYLGGGEVMFEVTLRSGQQYAKVFAKQNGIQNVSANIVDSEAVNGDGTSTYNYVK